MITGPLSSFVMPSDAELNRLREIVGLHYPDLIDSSGPAFSGSKSARMQDWNDQFKLAFLALGNMRRLDQPDHKRYASHWIEEAEIWLRPRGKSTTLRFGPFTAALLAHGDIPFSGLCMSGQVPEFGLSLYVGREARDAWRHVLSSGRILPMSAVKTPMAPAAPVRVVSAW